MKKGISFLLSIFGLFIFCTAAISMVNFSGLINFNPGGSTGSDSTGSSGPTGSDATTSTIPDSRIVPHIGTTVRPAISQYPGVIVPTKYIADERYDKDLSACPVPPVCPDINGKTANNATANCPDTCTVTRQIYFMDPNNPDSQILGTFMPLCPKNYSSVAVYKMGKEIVLASENEYAPFPIPSLATYNNYVMAGYDCSEFVFNRAQVSTACYFKNPDFTSGQVMMINGYVGKYTDYSDDGTDWSIGSNCGVAAVGQTYVYRSYKVYWRYVKCFRQAGALYYTDNMVPTSIVCSHVQPVWQTGN